MREWLNKTLIYKFFNLYFFKLSENFAEKQNL